MILCLYVPQAFALLDQSADGGQPGEYLTELSGGARGLALGLAQVSLDGQANLLYSNPASIAGMGWKEASFDFLPLFDQSQFASLSFACPVGGRTALGVSLMRLTSGDAEKTDILGQTIGTFSDQETALIVGAGMKLTSDLSCGLSVKMVSQDIDTLSENGFGADVGLVYHYAPGHTWGLSVMNVVAPVLGPDRFPLTVRGGFSHNIFIKDLYWNGDVSALDIFTDQVVNWYTGFEFNRPEWFFWRLGANEKQFSAGFGVGTKQIDIDYAFVYHPLETLQSVSMNIRYGYPSTEAELRALQKIEEMKKEKEELSEDARKQNDDIKFERERLNREKKLALKFIEAKKAFEDKKYAAASATLKEILKADPGYEEAKVLSDVIKAKLSSENVVLRLQYARQAYSKGAYNEAKDHVSFVLEMQPDNQEARVISYLSGAQIYLSNKEFKEAKGELIEVLKIDPNNNEASQLLKRVQNILDIYGGQ